MTPDFNQANTHNKDHWEKMWFILQRLSDVPDVWNKLELHFKHQGEFSPITFTHLTETGLKNLSDYHMGTVLDVVIESKLSVSKFIFLFLFSCDCIDAAED